MQRVWMVGTLCLLVCALRFSEGAAPGTELCGTVLAAYSPTTLNKIWISTVQAQGFQVIDRSRLFNITSSFFTVASASALVSAEIYADASGNGTASVPGSPLANASFAVAEQVFHAYSNVYAGRLEERTFQAVDEDGIHLEPGYYWLVVNMPSSMGWGINILSPRDTSLPVVISNMVTSSDFERWETLHHTAMITFNGCYIIRPSPSPSSSPSPSIAPAVRPITVNVTASFDKEQPTVNVSAPIGTAPASSSPTTTVISTLGDIQLGNTSIPLQDLGGFEVSQKTATVPGASSTYVYTARLDNATTLEHSYTFHSKQQQTAFQGMPFTITPSSLKWSVNLTVGDESALPLESLTLQYQLAGLVTADDGASIPANGFRVGAKSNWPQASMTTYILPLSTLVAAELQLFDVALVDGVVVPLQHQVKLVSNPPVASSVGNGTSESTAVYVLQLTFPPVNRSLFYDPSLGLGVLLGAPGGKDSSSDNSGLLIGVAVAVPLAILFVLTVVIVGFSFIYWRKRRTATNLRRRLSTMHSRTESSKLNDDL